MLVGVLVDVLVHVAVDVVGLWLRTKAGLCLRGEFSCMLLDLFPECRNGRVRLRFDSFLQRVLYHPQHGYYCRPDLRFGKQGDFYTSPQVHPFFAEILSEHFLQVWENLDQPRPFVLFECGPGDGTLALQLLSTIGQRFERFAAAVRYIGLEVSHSLAEKQRQKLASFPANIVISRQLSAVSSQLSGVSCQLSATTPPVVAWQSQPIIEKFSAVGLSPFEGVIFSNEFFDALPFRRIKRGRGRWLEQFVEIETTGIRTRWESTRWRPDTDIRLQIGGIVEWRDCAEDFYRLASRVLKKGIMLHIDYGDKRENLNPRGTMRTFFRHRLGEDPFVHLGKQDITASVDFSHLIDLGQRYGFRSCLSRQREYLMERGILEKIALRFQNPRATQVKILQEKLALKNLIVPGGISDHFKVLLQEKG